MGVKSRKAGKKFYPSNEKKLARVEKSESKEGKQRENSTQEEKKQARRGEVALWH